MDRQALLHSFRGIKALFYLYMPVVIVTLIVIGITIADHLNIGLFIRDQASITHSNPFYGMLSEIGILFWGATVALCVFGIVLLPKTPDQRTPRSLFLSIAVITLMLMSDDLFLFHEVVFPEYLHIGEKLLLIVYFGALFTIFYRFRTFLRGTNWGILLLSGGLLGMSIAIDRLPEAWLGDWSYFVEDAPKLFGIITWCFFWGYVVRQTVLDSFATQKSTSPASVKNYAARQSPRQTL